MNGEGVAVWQQLAYSRAKHIVINGGGEYPDYVTKTLCGIATHRTMFPAVQGTHQCRKCRSALDRLDAAKAGGEDA